MARRARGAAAAGGRVLKPIRPGMLAPDATLAASTGGTIRLSDCWRDAHVLLLFYPGNDTPG